MTHKQIEPTEPWQTQQHQRILRQDPTAFAELCEMALPHLVSFLQQKFPKAETHLHENTAIDCLLAYNAKPTQYDPEQLTLFGYLRMAVRYDMLTALRKSQRRQEKIVSIDDPSIQSKIPASDELGDDFILDEWLTQYTNESVSEILSTVDALLNDQEKHVLMLMLEGERKTERYADVMGLSDSDYARQKHEVKKVKDRINKKLRRFGNQLRED